MRRSGSTRARPVVDPVRLDVAHEVWGHCPHCGVWFVVEDPCLDALLLCPADLHRADETQVRLPE